MNVAKNLGKYLKQHHIPISELSRKTGYAYQNLYASLAGKSDRDLRAEELIGICKALDLNPMDFYDVSDIQDGYKGKIIIGEKEYSDITVATEEGEVVASISADDIIEKQGYKVMCTPCVD